MMPEDYELVVIGAGPAGMEAAISASESGVKTAIVEGLPLVGGQCYRRLPAPFAPSRLTPAGQQGEALIQRLESTLTAKYNDALAWGLFEDRAQQGWLVALEGSGSPAWLHARTLVIAAGAYDTPVAFPGWTLPGVITCGAALILAKSQRIAPGRRAVVSGSGPLLLSAAAHLTELGVEITVVCETSKPFPRALALAPTLVRKSDILPEAAKYLGSLIRSRTPYKFGWSVFEFGRRRPRGARADWPSRSAGIPDFWNRAKARGRYGGLRLRAHAKCKLGTNARLPNGLRRSHRGLAPRP